MPTNNAPKKIRTSWLQSSLKHATTNNTNPIINKSIPRIIPTFISSPLSYVKRTFGAMINARPTEAITVPSNTFNIAFISHLSSLHTAVIIKTPTNNKTAPMINCFDNNYVTPLYYYLKISSNKSPKPIIHIIVEIIVRSNIVAFQTFLLYIDIKITSPNNNKSAPTIIDSTTNSITSFLLFFECLICRVIHHNLYQSDSDIYQSFQIIFPYLN